MSEILRCIGLTHIGSAQGEEIEKMYDGSLDAVVINNAFSVEAVNEAVKTFAEHEDLEDWNRPNKPVPGIDLRLLGIGAAPCATMPQGPNIDTYLETANKTGAAIKRLFGAGFDPFGAIEHCLGLLSGRHVCIPCTKNGRRFSPCTIRVLPAGEGLMVHHDDHYRLPVYADVRNQIDTSLLLSFFVVLQRPDSGGRLRVYARGPRDDAELPHMANGLPDPVGFDRLVPYQNFDLAPGDMIVFASGRLYHTVEKVAGRDARITIGGFLGLDKTHSRCFYWS